MPQSKIRRYLRHGMLPQLSVFEAVVRLGSFTRAAEELHMAQPTVSVQIKKLTETIGMPLIEQVGKSIRLTPEGKELQAMCHEIFLSFTRFEEHVAKLGTMQSGSLDIAVSRAAKNVASRMLVEFAKTYPQVTVRQHVGHRQSLLERMADNSDDMYLMATPPDGNAAVSVRLVSNLVVVLARNDHPLAGQSNISFARFAKEPLILREPGSGTRMVTEQLFSERKVAPNIRMELGSGESVRDALLAGLGVAVMPLELAQEDAAGALTQLDVEGFPLNLHWHLVYPVGKRLSTVAQTFVDFARQTAQRMAKNAPETVHT